MSQPSRIDRFFGVTRSGSSYATEVRAGVTTFLTMAYILFVNPAILSEAITSDSGNIAPMLMTATALAAAFGCLTMGLIARYPYALAPGMGLNAYFTYTVVLGQGVPWQTALGAVFISGVLFLAISLAGFREVLIRAIPSGLKNAITAGIGCFLATIGFINAGLVVDHPVTLVAMGSLAEPAAIIVLAGLILTVTLLVFQVRGAILIGIAAASLVAALTGAPVYRGQAFAGFSEGVIRAPVWPSELFLAFDPVSALNMGVLTIVFTFLFVDFFDTTGTLIGLSRRTGMLDDQGNMPRSRAAFSADALATVFGSLVGTSSTTSYIESVSGIEDGGRTGLTAVTVAILFLLSLFFWPLAAVVPAAATAPAMIIIGAMMMFASVQIDWEDYRESAPALLTILGMPLTYSITNGISLGLITYCLIQVLTGGLKKIHWLLGVLTLLLLARFFFLGQA